MKFFRELIALSLGVVLFFPASGTYAAVQLLAALDSPIRPTYIRVAEGLTEQGFSFSLSQTDQIGSGAVVARLLDDVFHADPSSANYVIDDASSGDAFDLAVSLLQDDSPGLFLFITPTLGGLFGTEGDSVLTIAENSLALTSGVGSLRQATIESIVLNLTDASFVPTDLPAFPNRPPGFPEGPGVAPRDGGVGTEASVTVSFQIFGTIPEPTGLVGLLLTQ